ncbi:MAG: GPR endopeptidase [Eubacterium sp.]|nr:GPR endopeptidase [Eubacterium sp.]MBR7072860.1 GPR endopeptidase [Eubacterium sp.]
MQNRTDLALESYEGAEASRLEGVEVKRSGGITTVKVTDENGAKALGKPVGNYVTLEVKSFVNDTDVFDGRLDTFANVLRSILPENVSSVLVAGLGNKNITADSLGPKTNSYVLSTRHILDELRSTSGLEGLFCVSSVSTGVLGETGIETAELIRGIAAQIKPSCIITVDALAATSMERLGTTVQFSDSGISPGSGVGNHRHEISFKTVGVPVISIGIPTVVSTSVLSPSGDSGAYVTPREIDRISEHGAKLIGMGINVCLHKGLSAKDLYALVG